MSVEPLQTRSGKRRYQSLAFRSHRTTAREKPHKIPGPGAFLLSDSRRGSFKATCPSQPTHRVPDCMACSPDQNRNVHFPNWLVLLLGRARLARSPTQLPSLVSGSPAQRADPSPSVLPPGAALMDPSCPAPPPGHPAVLCSCLSCPQARGYLGRHTAALPLALSIPFIRPGTSLLQSPSA